MELPEDAQASLQEGLFSLPKEALVFPAGLKSESLSKKFFA